MSFQVLQKQLADHLRDPVSHAPPTGLEDRRLGIYRELIYNNMESFISGGFPVLRALYPDADWHRLVRTFLATHRCVSPYFLDIGREFLTFLQDDYPLADSDPPFLQELAHYEWVELALDVADTDLDVLPVDPGGDLLERTPVVSPLAWRLSYQYPVHRISPEYKPLEPAAEPVFLLVWRNRAEQVRFMEVNAATCRLLQILEEGEASSGGQALYQLAREMQHPDPQALSRFGVDLLRQLADLEVILGAAL